MLKANLVPGAPPCGPAKWPAPHWTKLRSEFGVAGRDSTLGSVKGVDPRVGLLAGLVAATRVTRKQIDGGTCRMRLVWCIDSL